MPLKPLKIDKFETGLVQDRPDFALKDDAFITLENAYVFRERLQRKRGSAFIGRLRRCLGSATTSYFDSGSSPWSFNIKKITGYISDIDITGSPTLVITTPYAHGLSTNDQIVISGVVGTTDVNGNTYTITVTGTTTFTVNQASVNNYTSGGFWFSDRASDETESSIEPNSFSIIISGVTVTDDGAGNLSGVGITGTIDYYTGDITITGAAGSATTTLEYCYFPTLPVMGIWQRELTEVNDEQTHVFDTRYCYRYNQVSKKFQELESATATTWSGEDYNFFWCTNYWNVSSGANQALLFWATNGSDSSGDPIRYYDPTTATATWVEFGGGSAVAANRTGRITTASNIFLNGALILEPFRSRLLAFNTWEGSDLANSQNYPNRIRWSQIGNPLIVDDADDSGGLEGSWRSDIRGKGGFLDLPTNESITAIGFVRDNLIVYCDRSTWKLRYTGQAISPFAPEKVNTELGVESTNSSINFDTYNTGIGDKGIVSTDSYKADRIDYKIPDLVYTINNEDEGVKRVHGLRDFEQRLAYWVYCEETNENKFPNKRLIYNYENDSWAIFEDSYTALGVFQTQDAVRWQDVDQTWQEYQDIWQQTQTDLRPENIGGNQKGYVSFLDAKYSNNEKSLPIEDITIGTGVKTTLTIVNHNLNDGQFITIENIAGTADYTSLNGNTYKVFVEDNDTVRLIGYDSTVGVEQYTSPFDITPSSPSAYYGLGEVAVKDNFRIVTKKYSHIEEGKNTVFGFMDILCDTTFNGEFSLNAYVDYSEEAVNTSRTVQANPLQKDAFFNAVISTASTTNEPHDTTKTYQRVNCNFRGRFISLEFTFNDKQMNGNSSLQDVNIYNYVLWQRAGGHLGY